MTRHSLSLLAATAAFALFGGLDFEIAAGRALDRFVPDDARAQTGADIAVAGINRSAKRDRDEVSVSSAAGRTITFQHPDLPSTTVALRLWETAGAAKSRPALKARKTPDEKPKQTVACEGVVSALTEIAKQLDAGRCIT
jgi:hypothetical protein